EIMVTSGTNCGAAYTTSNPVPVTVTNANTFTYQNGSSTSGNGNRACSISYLPQVFLGNVTASKSSSTVTMTINNHGLSTGDRISVSNGSGTCGTAYVTNNAVVTVVDKNKFTYQNGSGGTTNSSCRVSRYPYQYAHQITGRPHY